MDEHIVQHILGLQLEDEVARKIEDMMRRCANTAQTYIRREDTEAQSTKAFYIFARTTRVMFRIGASMELHRLGYKFEKVNLGEEGVC
jgi:hypothetical protein